MFLFRWISYLVENFASVVRIVCVVLLFGMVISFVNSFRQDSNQTSKPGAQQNTATTVAAPPVSGGTPQATTTSVAPTSVVPTGPTPAEIRSQLQTALVQLVESTARVDSALKSIDKWNSEIPQLLKTEAGDNIAAHDDLVERLTEIVEKERTPESELTKRSARIQALRSDLDGRAAASSPTPLTTNEKEEISELEEIASVADDEWSDALNDARAVKLIADDRVKPDTTGSLEYEIKLKAAEKRIAELEEQLRRKKAREAQLAEQDRERERIAAERERERVRRADKHKEEAAAAAERQRLENEKLLARARSTEVQATLAPFLHKRDVQPQKSGGGSVRFQSTFESKPMSLSALKGMGALDESVEGLKWLARVGGNRKLSQPRWGVYSQPGNWSEGDKRLLTEAQQLLRELGPTLVEAGLLSP